ncbi:hypothetical protein BDV98DRAFT_608023 [Pterulicium gracile]|uniref:F-box domain-containing protein n=1 Tax=Pterulicium gracile TaxID=1884261 RepID=A0A5C3Q457_9AGAR|nr:hypothetical protein BDV98DRAFT_608023 [Pterula gracilis]
MTAWCLSRVSSRWRAIALVSPQLWATVLLDIPRIEWLSSRIRNEPEIGEYLLLELERSQTLPLQIQVMSLSEPYPLFEVLLEESARWEVALFRLAIDAMPVNPAGRSNNVCMLRSMLPLSGRCPALHTLALDVDESMGAVSGENIWTFTNFPKLEFVELHKTLIDAVNVPWSQLKTLELREVYSLAHDDQRYVYEVLKQCSSLERLGLRYHHTVTYGEDSFVEAAPPGGDTFDQGSSLGWQPADDCQVDLVESEESEESEEYDFDGYDVDDL